MKYSYFTFGIIYGMWLSIFLKDRYNNYYQDITWFILFSLLTISFEKLLKKFKIVS